jgi:hypothetical protein
MTIHQQLSGALSVVSLILLGIFPNQISLAFAFLAAISLYAFMSYLQKSNDHRIVAFEKRMKDLDEKMNTLMLGSGMRR